MSTLRIKMRKKINHETFRISINAKTYHELIKYYMKIEHRLREMNLLEKLKFDAKENRSQSSGKSNNDKSQRKNSSRVLTLKIEIDSNKSKDKNKLKFDRFKNKKNKAKISLKDVTCYECNQKGHYKSNFVCSKYEKRNENRN